MKRVSFGVLVASSLPVCLLGALACSDVQVPNSHLQAIDSTVHAVVIDRASVNLTIGATITLAASLDAGPGVADRSVIWSTADQSIATVNQTGLVTGVAVGRTNAIATARADTSVRATATITVVAPGGHDER